MENEEKNINKRSELVSKSRHQLKFKLGSVKPIRNKDRVVSQVESLNMLTGGEREVAETEGVRDCQVNLSPIQTKLVKDCHVVIKPLIHSTIPEVRTDSIPRNTSLPNI